MIDISKKLDELSITKNQIKEAIKNKGVSVLDEDAFSIYPSKIDSIEKGGNAKVYIKKNIKKTISSTATIQDYFVFDEFNWEDLGSITTINGLFSAMKYRYPEIKSLDLSKLNCTLNTANGAKVIGGYDVPNIEKLIINNWKIDLRHKLTLINNSQTIKTAIINNWTISQNALLGDLISSNCSNIELIEMKNLSFGPSVTVLNENRPVFYGYNKLKRLDMEGSDFGGFKNIKELFKFGSLNSTLTDVVWPNNMGKGFDFTSVLTWDFGNASVLSHESILDLFNKIQPITQNVTIKLHANVYGTLSPEEIAIATNKGWTVTQA